LSWCKVRLQIFSRRGAINKIFQLSKFTHHTRNTKAARRSRRCLPSRHIKALGDIHRKRREF